jgi:hypothetical protein
MNQVPIMTVATTAAENTLQRLVCATCRGCIAEHTKQHTTAYDNTATGIIPLARAHVCGAGAAGTKRRPQNDSCHITPRFGGAA